jgi:very-short-patch-repair endonuclease
MDDAAARIRLVRDLVRNGVGPQALARGVRDGTWTRVRRGACVEGSLSDDAVVRHCELIAATIPLLKADSWVLSYTSAAVVLGLPVPYEGLESAWITRPGGRSAHRRQQLMTRVCEFEDDEIITVGGLAVTCPERTAIDMARQHGFPDGLMVADAVLRAGGSLTKMQELVVRSARRPGNRAAVRSVELASPVPESPGESKMRAHLARLGCPLPELQFTLRTPEGRFVSRNDFGWPEWKVVGEYDGMGKYTDLRRPGETIADVIAREKAREADIRDQGYEIARFMAKDLRQPEQAAARLLKLLRANGYTGTRPGGA